MGRVKSMGKLEAKSVSSRLELGIDVKLKLIGEFLEARHSINFVFKEKNNIFSFKRLIK